MKSFYLILFLSFSLTIGYSQTIHKANFIKIAELYLKYLPSKFPIDTSKTVFIISADSSTDKTFFFEITAYSTFDIFKAKYSEVYNLAGYKLIINENSNRYQILTNLFEKRPYENLNNGKPPMPGLIIDHFHHWVFLMNDQFEIMQVNGLPPNFSPVRKLVKKLKRNKVVFAKSPFS